MDNTTQTQSATATEYTEEERRSYIQKYFKVTELQIPPINHNVLLSLLGLFIGLVLMGYLKRAVPTIIFCTTCYIFAAWQFWIYIAPYIHKRRIFNSRRTEDVMAAWLIKDFKETVKPRAISTLSLNMSDVRPENFIIIPTPIYWNAPGIDPSQIKRSPLPDGTFNYSVWRVQVLVLTRHYISLFKCTYNWLDNSVSSISTNEFYFQDITSIRNDMREIEYNFIDNPEAPIGGGKVFCVTNFSGEYLTVVNDIPSLKVNKVVAVDLEYIVSLLRMVIRNRRFGITHEKVSTQELQQASEKNEQDEAQKEKNVEDINSIEYLLHKRDVEMNQEESQFGGAPLSSFDDGVDVKTIEQIQQEQAQSGGTDA
ncbi:MAG: hypothetical protein K6F33_01755 [Bacteroidales bacterium]|nr:hypothetical protein [Bacteroidales bacterium]